MEKKGETPELAKDRVKLRDENGQIWRNFGGVLRDRWHTEVVLSSPRFAVSLGGQSNERMRETIGYGSNEAVNGFGMRGNESARKYMRSFLPG